MSQIVILTPEEMRVLICQAVRDSVPYASPEDVPPVMTEAQAAEYLHIPHNTLRNWRTVSRGPRYVKNGKIIRYRREDLDNWLRKNAVMTGDDRD